ncbi:PREDICTED: uncharacterized protein LOC109153919 [Ipomoea nil]|uniref:uncharacterized protein LOC109153919 n=1 Tax=Ipomoea nil TaxID=35883 RepID=UPI00090178DD|nr:PREDICTED: uncharacterized protein LOC109153919 [Ipomoea nil]
MIAEALSLAGRPLSPDEQILYVLRGLRPEFRTMAYSLTASGATVSLSQLSDFLQAQEFIHEDDFAVADTAVGSSSPAAFYAGRGRHGNDHTSGRHSGGRGGRQNRGRNNQGRQSRGGGLRCQICRAHGHTAVYCYKRYTERPAGHTNVAVFSENAANMTSDVWFPDTGATSHATPDEQMIGHSEAYTGGDIFKIGNGTVYRFTNDNDVYFEFHKNLFLVKDCNTREVLLKGFTSGGLYKLLVPSSPCAFLTARASSEMTIRVIAGFTHYG